jgi:hypothetical protein
MRVADVEAADAAGEVDEGIAVDVGEGGAAALLDHYREKDGQRVGDDLRFPLQDLPRSGSRNGRFQLDCPRHRHAADDTRATGRMKSCIGPIQPEYDPCARVFEIHMVVGS